MRKTNEEDYRRTANLKESKVLKNLPLVVSGTAVALTAYARKDSILGAIKDISDQYSGPSDDDFSGGDSGGGGGVTSSGGGEGVSEFVGEVGLLVLIGFITYLAVQTAQNSFQEQRTVAA